MKRTLMAVAVTGFLVSGSALGQEATTPAPAQTAPAGEAPAMAPAAVKSDGYLASKIIGETVYNSTAENAEQIGEVNDIVVDGSGAAKSLIIGVGGFLGVGERNVAVDFATAKWAEKDGDRWLVVETSKEQLEGMAPFDTAPYEPAPAVAPATPSATTPPAGEAPKPAN